jgi:hypothetical protein
MTPEQENKQIERKLRTIPVEAISSMVAAEEAALQATICLVGNDPEFVRPEGRHPQSETTWDFDPLEHAQIVRWLRAHPERVQLTYESALAFVRLRSSN